MKKLFLISVMLLIGIAAKAQWSVGIMAGYDYNVYSCDKNFAYDYRYGDRGGLEVTVPVQYNFNEWFGVRADLSYLQKGHTMHRTGLLEGTYIDTRDHYMQIPITASFSFGGKKLRGWFNPGVYGGYWLASRRSGMMSVNNITGGYSDLFLSYIPENAYPFDEKLDFESRRDNRLDAGLTGTVGVGYRFLSNMEARVEGSCYYSLVSKTAGTELNVSNSYDTTFSLRAGVAYYFGKKSDKKK